MLPRCFSNKEHQHFICKIPPTFCCNQSWRFRVTYKTHGFTGYAETCLNFRAHVNKLKVVTQGPGYIPVMTMSSVVTHLFAEKTWTDSDFYLFHGLFLYLQVIYNRETGIYSSYRVHMIHWNAIREIEPIVECFEDYPPKLLLTVPTPWKLSILTLVVAFISGIKSLVKEGFFQWKQRSVITFNYLKL